MILNGPPSREPSGYHPLIDITLFLMAFFYVFHHVPDGGFRDSH